MLERDIRLVEMTGARYHASQISCATSLDVIRSAKAKGSPSPFVKTFAYTAVPTGRGETGMRSYCGDSTGRVCVTEDGSEPAVVGGLCTPCVELKPSEMKQAPKK